LIVDLYDRLCELADSPVVHLNRAIALSHRDGGEVGLAELEPLAEELDAYHLFHAARAEMLKQLGRDREALACERRALQLTANPAERRLLERRLASSRLYGEYLSPATGVPAKPASWGGGVRGVGGVPGEAGGGGLSAPAV